MYTKLLPFKIIWVGRPLTPLTSKEEMKADDCPPETDEANKEIKNKNDNRRGNDRDDNDVNDESGAGRW